jgi:putative transposase
MTIAGQYYHILNRGNGKQKIFHAEKHYQFFMKRLLANLHAHKPVLIAYCLMPNHFHLFVRETKDNSIGKMMHALQTSYAKALNKDLHKTGHLFQDTFKRIHVETNPQLLHLSRYIHMNPVRAGLVIQPEDWEYSSYRDYIGHNNNRFVDPAIILSQFHNPDQYRDFVNDNSNRFALDGLTLE